MTTPPIPIPILLLKTRSIPHDGYEEYFSSSHSNTSLKFTPTFVPVLEHTFDAANLEIVRGYLMGREVRRDGEGRYGGMIFTSQRAVEAFGRLVEEGAGEGEEECDVSDGSTYPHLRDIPIYTVGPATARALRSISTTPPLQIHGEECGNGEVLAHHILKHYTSIYASLPTNPPLLFLVGEQRRDIIPKTLQDPKLGLKERVQVDELPVYGTGVMESFKEEFRGLLEETKDAGVRWVVVFSPTGCEAMLAELGMLDVETRRVKTGERGGGCGNRKSGGRETYIATIGPTTRDYLRKTFGFEPDVCAETPSPEGIGKGIADFMRKVEARK